MFMALSTKDECFGVVDDAMASSYYIILNPSTHR